MPDSGSGSGTPISPGSPITSSIAQPVGELRQFPLLPLESFRAQISYNPWHFWGMSGSSVPVTSSCNSVVKKYGWQGVDAAGRRDIEASIVVAEQKIADVLGYWPSPKYIVETVDFPRYPDVKASKFGYSGGDGRWTAINLRYGYIQSVGVLMRSAIGTAVVSYSDSDSDGITDLFTISLTTTVTDVSQIAVYFAAADRPNYEEVSEHWRISPVSVSIASGTATIRGRSWMLAKPVLHEGYDPANIDPADSSNYVTTLEVYRLYVEPDGTTTDTSQAKLIWETDPYPEWSSCCSGDSNDTDPAALAYAMARVGIRNAREGVIYLGEAAYNDSTGNWYKVDWSTCRPPDRVEIRYTSGYPLVGGMMDYGMQTSVARVAAAELNRRICACDIANRELYHWQFDLTKTNDVESFSLGPEDLTNPLGTRRGHMNVWRSIKVQRRLYAFAV